MGEASTKGSISMQASSNIETRIPEKKGMIQIQGELTHARATDDQPMTLTLEKVMALPVGENSIIPDVSAIGTEGGEPTILEATVNGSGWGASSLGPQRRRNSIR